MTNLNPTAMHDQVLAYIQNDAITTNIDGGNSLEIIAHRFEQFWRLRIAYELDFLEEPTNISSDYYGACRRMKTAAIAIASKGIPRGLI
jgi:hypothetical protein